MEKVLQYPCSCGGKLRQSFCSVEFFGIDFGEQPCEICASCGSEFLDDRMMAKIEESVKQKKLFGLEKQITVAKSGNSLVFRIPPEIVKFTNVKVKHLARMFPINKNRIEIEILG